MTAFLTKDRVAEKVAFASLALGSRRRAHQYRRWAEAAEQAGKLEEYRRWRSEADRCWALARSAIRSAMNHADAA